MQAKNNAIAQTENPQVRIPSTHVVQKLGGSRFVQMPTPCGVLDRMCESIIRHDTVAFMDDVQLFWGKEWDLAQVPDPNEEDALKYALKACFLERMAEVWSEPPKSHPSTAPDWCRRVPAVKEHFSVIPPEYQKFFDGRLVSPIFSKRNIFAPRDFIFFV